MTEHEQLKLQTRVANLETALHVLWALMRDVPPPHVQRDVDAALGTHYDVTVKLAGRVGVDFESTVAEVAQPKITVGINERTKQS